MELKKALEEIRRGEERKFEQSIDLIVNLRKFDIKKNSINTFIILPHKIKDKKICGFLETKTNLIDIIPKANFIGYKDKKSIKKLVKKYDFFVASAPLMPAVATTFGRILGPAGKMPSPKLGIIMGESENNIKEVIKKINNTIRVQTKEPSIKIIIAREKMKDDDILENIKSAYNSIINELPNKKENIKSVMIKLTMGKPVKVEM
jgi:large subunit ribosomal protein L1